MSSISVQPIVDRSIKGDIMILDPRSKLLITLSMVIGISLSIEPFQVFLFACMLIPIAILYRPKVSIFRRILVTLPLVFVLALIVFLVLENKVELHIFQFSRTYSPFQFAFLNAYRFTISVAHTSILLESEGSNIEIIDALASFRWGRGLVSILLLVHRIATRLQYDYSKMTDAANTKGMLSKGGITLFFLKLRVMGRVLSRAMIYSDSIGYTLTARGFHGDISETSRDWSSEGVTLLILAILFSILFVMIPFLRPPR
ncbi:MAG: CbiQ family ECF transporter T component [Candidatus Kariarchaeaceae archaeon]